MNPARKKILAQRGDLRINCPADAEVVELVDTLS
jgi:hypothetical protein